MHALLMSDEVSIDATYLHQTGGTASQPAGSVVCVTLEVVRKLRGHTNEIPVQSSHISTGTSILATIFSVECNRPLINRAHC
jgi:hypothetical protein